MSSLPQNPMGRPRFSRILDDVRAQRRLAFRTMDPGQKMQAAFTLSLEARLLMIAGLRAKGFDEAEIYAVLKARRK